jgi:FKBP-type peptidyl-prolyl cis-trans isomerase 2
MTDAINERRSSPRFALTVAAVSESFSPCEMIGRLTDVSRTRCFVDTVNPPTPGMHVKIRLRIEDEHFETLAKVIHVLLQRGMRLLGHEPAGTEPRSTQSLASFEPIR